MKKEILGIECKFVQHIPKDDLINRPDMHYVKEVIHYSDGSLEPNFKMIKNYQRPFWITKEHKKNHKQKKETEDINNLNMYTSTQSDLAQNVQIRLNRGYRKVTSLRDVAGSPYVYGLDIDGRSDIKFRYKQKYPECESNFTVCGLDIETSMDDEEILLITVVFQKEIYTVILKEFLPTDYDLENKLKILYNQYIPDENKDKYKLRFEVYDNQVDMIKNIFTQIHKWQPDFLEAWNMVFDFTKIVETLEKNKIDPKDIFSDPSVPENYRYFYFKKSGKRESASGVVKNTSPHEQWNYIITPSTFYCIDGMCTYHFIRTTDKAIPGGYGLDNMIKNILGKDYQKLKFKNIDDELENTEGLPIWHSLMQKKYPLEYTIYNIWDVMSMLKIDDKLTDLKSTISVLSENSSFDIFNSLPKRIMINYHFFLLEYEGRVLGTKDPLLKENEDLWLDEWIVMLMSHRISEGGDNYVDGCEDLKLLLRLFVFDAD